MDIDFLTTEAYVRHLIIKHMSKENDNKDKSGEVIETLCAFYSDFVAWSVMCEDKYWNGHFIETEEVFLSLSDALKQVYWGTLTETRNAYKKQWENRPQKS